MKLLFFITSRKGSNTGFGGHYYSLLTYTDVLKDYFDITILHYSELENTILDSIDFEDIKYFKTKTINPKRLKDFFNFNVVIFFRATLFSNKLKNAFIFKKIPVIAVKPGGKNPKIYYSYFDYIICFSDENYRWFKTKYTYKNKSCITLLPNRIKSIGRNESRLKEFNFTKENHINILRISKISESYQDTFLKTINLHKILYDKNILVNLVIIGRIENQNTYEKILIAANQHKNITILTDNKYTNNARELIPMFDIVTGIGRGFMEAVSEKIITLGFSRSYSIPIIVDKDNYDIFKQYNFSLRNDFQGRSSEQEFCKILNLISSIEEQKKLKNFLFDKYIQDYDAQKVIAFFMNTNFKKRINIKYFILDFTCNIIVSLYMNAKAFYRKLKHFEI